VVAGVRAGREEEAMLGSGVDKVDETSGRVGVARRLAAATSIPAIAAST
jgi:hypothetical protein